MCAPMADMDGEHSVPFLMQGFSAAEKLKPLLCPMGGTVVYQKQAKPSAEKGGKRKRGEDKDASASKKAKAKARGRPKKGSEGPEVIAAAKAKAKAPKAVSDGPPQEVLAVGAAAVSGKDSVLIAAGDLGAGAHEEEEEDISSPQAEETHGSREKLFLDDAAAAVESCLAGLVESSINWKAVAHALSKCLRFAMTGEYKGTDTGGKAISSWSTTRNLIKKGLIDTHSLSRTSAAKAGLTQDIISALNAIAVGQNESNAEAEMKSVFEDPGACTKLRNALADFDQTMPVTMQKGFNFILSKVWEQSKARGTAEASLDVHGLLRFVAEQFEALEVEKQGGVRSKIARSLAEALAAKPTAVPEVAKHVFPSVSDVEGFLTLRVSLTIAVLGVMAGGRSRATADDHTQALANFNAFQKQVANLELHFASWGDWADLWDTLVAEAAVSQEKLKDFVDRERVRLEKAAKAKAEKSQALVSAGAEAMRELEQEDKAQTELSLGKSIESIMDDTTVDVCPQAARACKLRASTLRLLCVRAVCSARSMDPAWMSVCKLPGARACA